MRHTPKPYRMERTERLPYDKLRFKFIEPCRHLFHGYLRVNVIRADNDVNVRVFRIDKLIDMLIQYRWYAAVFSAAHAMYI